MPSSGRHGVISSMRGCPNGDDASDPPSGVGAALFCGGGVGRVRDRETGARGEHAAAELGSDLCYGEVPGHHGRGGQEGEQAGGCAARAPAAASLSSTGVVAQSPDGVEQSSKPNRTEGVDAQDARAEAAPSSKASINKGAPPNGACTKVGILYGTVATVRPTTLGGECRGGRGRT